MTIRVLRYSVGNENDPGDPWGRSELMIQPDGVARLDHHFSRPPSLRAWTGRVDDAALDALWAALERAGFPGVPASPLVAGAATRRLTVEKDGCSQQAVIGWNATSGLPGYAEAFDILDGIARQLSGHAVTYPSSQPVIVRGVTAVTEPAG